MKQALANNGINQEVMEGDQNGTVQDNSGSLVNVKQETTDNAMGPMEVMDDSLFPGENPTASQPVQFIIEKPPIMTGASEKSYQCDTCGEAFEYCSTLLTHVMSHASENPLKCDTCGKSFNNYKDLMDHMSTHILDETPQSRSFCGDGSSTSGDPNEPPMKHTSERAYTCDACGKVYTHIGYLKRHRQSCAGENVCRVWEIILVSE